MHLRIKKWLSLNNQKASELANNIGVNRATISHILSGRNKPSIDFLEKLLHVYPNINANWLITGVGNINIDLLSFLFLIILKYSFLIALSI